MFLSSNVLAIMLLQVGCYEFVLPADFKSTEPLQGWEMC